MALDRAQLLNDNEEAFRLAFDGRQSQMWTALPGIVQSVDFGTMTCEVQPAIQGTVEDENGRIQSVNLPLLINVPIVFPSAGGFVMTFPLAADDEVLVVISSRCIDAWWQSGGVQRPIEMRMHDLSDGFAIPGPRSQATKVSSISVNSVQIRNDAGTTYVEVAASGKVRLISTDKIRIANSTKNLLGVINALNTNVSSINTALTTFATSVAAATTVVEVAAAATALQAALTPITALLSTYPTLETGALLE